MPLPVPPEVTLSHVALLVALQGQPVADDTATVPVPPAAEAFAEDGEIDGKHGAPSCVSVNVLPPIVSDPARAALEGLATTEYETEPSPVPEAPCVTVSQALLLVADQPQPLDAVTVTMPVEAVAAALAEVGEIVELHGTPAWVTVNVLPPMVSVPTRESVVVLAATL